MPTYYDTRVTASNLCGLELDSEKSDFGSASNFSRLGYRITQHGTSLPEGQLLRGLIQPERRKPPLVTDALQHFRALGCLHVVATLLFCSFFVLAISLHEPCCAGRILGDLEPWTLQLGFLFDSAPPLSQPGWSTVMWTCWVFI